MFYVILWVIYSFLLQTDFLKKQPQNNSRVEPKSDVCLDESGMSSLSLEKHLSFGRPERFVEMKSPIMFKIIPAQFLSVKQEDLEKGTFIVDSGRRKSHLKYFNRQQTSSETMIQKVNVKRKKSEEIYSEDRSCDSPRISNQDNILMKSNIHPDLQVSYLYSDSDLDNKERVMASLISKDGTDKIVEKCLICEDSIADTIIQDCGHGGICFECLMRYIEENNTCYYCRTVYIASNLGNEQGL